MKKFVSRTAITFAANAAGILASASWVSGFLLQKAEVKEILLLAAIFTALNIFVKPLLKLFLGPFIIITLGLGLIVVNAFLLYFLDLLSENLTITSIPSLFFATILLSVVNLIVHLIIKS